jgi:hypothetical protein
MCDGQGEKGEKEMSRPRTRTLSSCQRSYDNMTPEDVYGPDEPEEEKDDSVEEIEREPEGTDAT